MNLGLVRNDFSFEAAKTLSSLFDQPDFSDVTLVCEDQKQILAHKVILASGSPFFKNILASNPHPQPLIYLRVKFLDLQAIVSFMYTGQCKVAQNELDRFLEIAKSLDVVGLAKDEDVKKKNSETVNDANDEVSATEISETDNVSEKQTCDENKENEVDGIFEINRITREKETEDLCEIKGEPTENAEKTDPSCNECKLTFQTHPQLREHMSKDHQYCCNKIFSSKKSLRGHKYVQHNQKADGSHKNEPKNVDPDVYYPETEEKMSFFGIGRRENQAYDKHFFTFRCNFNNSVYGLIEPIVVK